MRIHAPDDWSGVAYGLALGLIRGGEAESPNS